MAVAKLVWNLAPGISTFDLPRSSQELLSPDFPRFTSPAASFDPPLRAPR